MAQSEKLADSLAGLIRKGGDFDAFSNNVRSEEYLCKWWNFGWFTQDQMLQPIADSAFFSNKNEVKVVRSNYGFHVLQVTDRSKPVDKVQIGIITKKLPRPNKRSTKFITTHVLLQTISIPLEDLRQL